MERPAVMLILYVLDGARACEVSRANVERAMRFFDPRVVELSVRNLSYVYEIDRTQRDRSVLIVPTLMMIKPREDYILGDLGAERVVEFIQSSGIEPRSTRS